MFNNSHVPLLPSGAVVDTMWICLCDFFFFMFNLVFADFVLNEGAM